MNSLSLPDIAAQTSSAQLPLERVGMAGIAQPVVLHGQRLAARISAGVSLDDAAARGIHMSRLYLALEALETEELSPALLARVLGEFLASHAGLSTAAHLEIRAEALLRRPALVSPLAGWKGYPLVVEARLDDRGLEVTLEVTIGYSSTCPCSAALARQLIQQRFAEDFAGQPLEPGAVLEWLGSSAGILATPHSQRSSATLRVRLRPGAAHLPLLALIERAEAALGTALQTAVKRADEQAFALANGQNLMFCEDAARRLHVALLAQPGLEAFELRVVHAESLHAHDAVAESRWSRETA
ncbi:GTP cyclohydrolase I FolE2 [Pseudomonas sp. A-1]|uniref:GTP cyclohydrolase FolE2 n=1 Tax=unclassified Pseudomonas TaxID=196821 RepID=UPI0010A637DC|nr:MULTISPECIES: GTP cyclohydrolase FolE2 [unclassified Pseudomonas]THG77595.1 GTP cyclohydrolase I FolE2 [Pseudomonas sp. A-1]WPP44475.1 GTP cyclohydrolase FolE2 [Pseudomonas sp. AN-1]